MRALIIMQAELRRLSVTLYLLLLMAVVLPQAITFSIAAGAQWLHEHTTVIEVAPAATQNSSYWPINLGVIIFAAVAAYMACSGLYGTARFFLPAWPVTNTMSYWLLYGLVAAFLTALSVSVCLVSLPAFFPVVYSQVSIAGSGGIRLIIGGACHAFSAVGLSIFVARACRHGAVAVAVLTIWALLVENALWLVPGGAQITAWMPFLNGVYGTGQAVALFSPWSLNGALLYEFLVAVVLNAAALLVGGVRGVLSHSTREVRR